MPCLPVTLSVLAITLLAHNQWSDDLQVETAKLRVFADCIMVAGLESATVREHLCYNHSIIMGFILRRILPNGYRDQYETIPSAQLMVQYPCPTDHSGMFRVPHLCNGPDR